MLAVILGIALVAIFLGLSYLIVAGLVWIICFGFGLEWSWLISLGVWALLILIRGGIKIGTGKND